jgi:UrcA family protein
MSTFNTVHSSTTWLPTLTAIACTLTGGTLLAAPAADEVPTMIVSFADLDLSKPAGAQALYQRIKHAARMVCAPLESRELGRRALWRDCYEQAVANTVVTLDRPTLTALHRATRTATG